ncbi:MAG: hypothetical protein NWE99_07430 [Candidatus Bathyarchaeota archaeon]|nr:hypothetical protein [Candidatus Bathyarchaeota archaeon]
MNRRTVALGIFLVAVISASLFVTIKLISDPEDPDFYVGVEFAYSDSINDLKALVDKVKDYTNLFVIGSIEITFNKTALDEACDYVVSSGLNLIVLITDSELYSYRTFEWAEQTKQKYGDKFLGVYRYDEPGGNQLDKGAAMLIKEGASYADVAANYTGTLKIILDYYLNYIDRVFTADYGLYWFDYKADYTTVFAEFGWNHSRALQTALSRGAARAFNKDWGVMVTWTYTDKPYIESADMLYSDLRLAYAAGAKYAVVFSYPKLGEYGILTEGHFDALKRFWDYIHGNPRSGGVDRAEAAYVLPEDYGFGFRSATDTIWGLFNADDLSAKVWNDANTLVAQYGSRLDIVYDDPATFTAIQNRYDKLYFWNETAP